VVSSSLDFLNLKVTGFNLSTNSNPCGTSQYSVLSLASDVTVKQLLYKHLKYYCDPIQVYYFSSYIKNCICTSTITNCNVARPVVTLTPAE
jgi:hypothetical protein